MNYWLAIVLVAVAGLPAVLVPGYLWELVVTGAWRDSGVWNLGVALIAGVEAHIMLRTTQRYRFLSTLQHEVSHLIAGLAVGARPTTLQVAGGNGLISYDLPGPQRESRTFLIAIAPYWFSPLILVPLLVFAVVQGPVAPWVQFLMAGITGMALALAIGQIHFAQTDLTRHGLGLSLLVVLWLWLACATLVLSIVATGSIAIVSQVYASAWSSVVEGAAWLRQHAVALIG